MPPASVTLSAARQKLFSLFESVTAHRGRKVIIRSRGSEDHAVLVGEAYLVELETAAQRLREIESGKSSLASEFKLIGSLKLNADVDDPLTDLRAEANLRAERKLRSFGR